MGAMCSRALTFEARAKVNLCLAISYPPHDGYHDARSVFQELDLHDVLRMHVSEDIAEDALRTGMGTRVALTCEVDDLDSRDNLVFRAVDAAEQACGCPWSRQVPRSSSTSRSASPAGGGLGGGSSDAAAALKAYAQLTGIDALDDRIVAVARELGADVAFFLHGQAALMGGRGDMFERALPPLQAPIVLMGSSDGLSTATVYRAFDGRPVPAPDADALARAMDDAPDDFACLAALCANNLGPAACAADPRIQRRIDTALMHPTYSTRSFPEAGRRASPSAPTSPVHSVSRAISLPCATGFAYVTFRRSLLENRGTLH